MKMVSIAHGSISPSTLRSTTPSKPLTTRPAHLQKTAPSPPPQGSRLARSDLAEQQPVYLHGFDAAADTIAAAATTGITSSSPLSSISSPTHVSSSITALYLSQSCHIIINITTTIVTITTTILTAIVKIAQRAHPPTPHQSTFFLPR